MSSSSAPPSGEDGARDERAAASTRTLETIVALGFIALGSLIMWDSARIGAGWGTDGPQSGYFPFYVGLLMNVASVANLWRAWRSPADEAGAPFVTRGQLRLVLTVLLPLGVYLALLHLIGLYLASALFIAVFMRWRGRFGYLKSVLTGIGVAVVLFAMFEIWFKVPLIKGPLEAALGY
jgi:hypothetical protein